MSIVRNFMSQDTNTTARYHPAQIILHWIVVIAIVLQIVFHESIVSVSAAVRDGKNPSPQDINFAWLHLIVGSIIFFAVIARLYLRFKNGVPAPSPKTSTTQAKIAHTVHWLLYALLLAMVITGGLTWNGVAALGGLHGAINIILFFLAVGHALAAVINHFVRKDGTLHRMRLKSTE
jgi:superoxide oxidase